MKKKFLFATLVTLLHLQSTVCLCGWKWKNSKTDLREWEKKKLFDHLGSACIVKNCDQKLKTKDFFESEQHSFFDGFLY